METRLVFVFAVSLFMSVNADLDPQKYLQQFGYLSENAYSREDFTRGLLKYQRTFGLSMTGQLDKDTLRLMNTPRCGNKDHVRSLGYRDTAWKKKYLSYYFHNYTPDMTQSEVRRLTEQAFRYWKEVTPLQFSERRNGDIVIAFGSKSHRDNKRTCYSPFDGRGGVLAHAFFPPDGRLHFDEDESYTHNSRSGTNYLWVATHELGHILGLEHDNQNRNAVMYPYYNKDSINGLKLHANDIRRIQQLYGKGGNGGTGTNPTPPPPPPPPGNCQDKTVNCYEFTHNCRASGWVDYMKKNCRRTCRYC